jgi:hypothetical protein
MCLCSGANTISLTAATSLPASWPWLVRGHDDRSVSAHAFSARRQAWYRPGSRPMIRKTMAKGRNASALVIARRMPAFAFPSGSRLPARLNPEARSKASNRRTTAARTRARFSQRALESLACCLFWSNGSVVTTGTEAALSPGRNGGTRDLNVPGNGPRAAANDVFAQTMIVGAACTRRVRDCGCHPRRITGTSENLNDIDAAAVANKKFRMSSFPARRRILPWARGSTAQQC